MKTDWSHLEPYRLRDAGDYSTETGDHFGFFVFPMPARQLRAMVSDGEETGWEHVSVSIMMKHGKKTWTRMPTWEEMCWVKGQFWNDGEAVVQFHPPKEEYVNNHPHCLHLWKCISQLFPLPPSIFVGLKELGTIV